MKNTGNFLAGILGGVIVGSVIGLLFAPEKGEETRGKLVNAFDDVKIKVKDILKKKGIVLDDNEIEDLVEELKAKAEAEAKI